MYINVYVNRIHLTANNLKITLIRKHFSSVRAIVSELPSFYFVWNGINDAKPLFAYFFRYVQN